MRVLAWIVDRVQGRADAVESPFGLMPPYDAITWSGLDFAPDSYSEIMDINREGALAEADELKDYFAQYGAKLPLELEAERQAFADRISKAPAVWEIKDAA